MRGFQPRSAAGAKEQRLADGGFVQGIKRAFGMDEERNAQIAAYRARAAAEKARQQAQAELYARMWEASMKQYEASQNLTLQAAKINGDALMHTNDARLDASKVGAQIMAQQVSSAFNAVATSASISGSANMSMTQQI